MPWNVKKKKNTCCPKSCIFCLSCCRFQFEMTVSNGKKMSAVVRNWATLACIQARTRTRFCFLFMHSNSILSVLVAAFPLVRFLLALFFVIDFGCEVNSNWILLFWSVSETSLACPLYPSEWHLLYLFYGSCSRIYGWESCCSTLQEWHIQDKLWCLQKPSKFNYTWYTYVMKSTTNTFSNNNNNF